MSNEREALVLREGKWEEVPTLIGLVVGDVVRLFEPDSAGGEELKGSPFTLEEEPFINGAGIESFVGKTSKGGI